MGAFMSRASEDDSNQQTSSPTQPTARRRQALQTPADTEWSLALSTQQQVNPAHRHCFSGIDQSKSLAIAQTTRTKEIQHKADALTAQAHAEHSLCTTLTISDAYPRPKPRTKASMRDDQRQRIPPDAVPEEHEPLPAATELHTLERLYRSAPHKMTLKLWIEEERLLRARIHELEYCCSSAEREIYLILGLSFIFQGIMVAGTAQASALNCRSSWVPLIMSLIISVATGFASLRKLAEREQFLSQLQVCKTDTKVMMAYIDKLRSLGDLFDLKDLPQLSSSMPAGGATCFPRRIITPRSLRFFALLLLCLFSVITLVSFRTILCGHGRGR